MEKNRILWVMLSAALFLVVVLAGGLFFLKPQAEEEIAVSTGVAGVGRDFDVFEYVRGKSELPVCKKWVCSFSVSEFTKTGRESA
ncbi:hypothetical protein ES705_34477 [subsurface metagenome]